MHADVCHLAAVLVQKWSHNISLGGEGGGWDTQYTVNYNNVKHYVKDFKYFKCYLDKVCIH